MKTKLLLIGALVIATGAALLFHYRATQAQAKLIAQQSTPAQPQMARTGMGGPLREEDITVLRESLRRTQEELARMKVRAGRAEAELNALSSSVQMAGTPGENTNEVTAQPAVVAQIAQIPTSVQKALINSMLRADRDNICEQLEKMGLTVEDEDFISALDALGTDRRSLYRMRSILLEWVKRDPQAAGAWVVGLTSAPKKVQALQHLISAWARTDASTASDWVKGLPEGTDRKLASEQLLRQVAYSNPQVATYWFDRVTNESMKGSIAPSIAMSLARKDLDSALQWVSALPDDQTRENSLRRVVMAVSETDPQEAVQLAEMIGKEDIRASAIADAIGAWAKTDPVASATYVKNLPAGPARDESIRRYATSVTATAPTVAVQWAEAIEDRSMRESAIRSVAYHWMQSDPKAVIEWVDGTDLSPKTKESLLRAARSRSSATAGNAVTGTSVSF